MKKISGYKLIAAERQRQIEVEGWTAEQDDEVGGENLVLAAQCYLNASDESSSQPQTWPFQSERWKPQTRQRNLERAGALYQAAADIAERAEDYSLRNRLIEQMASCAIRLDSITYDQSTMGGGLGAGTKLSEPQPKAMARRTGFYRVKEDGEWTIAHYDSGRDRWASMGEGGVCDDGSWEEIDPERIPMPADDKNSNKVDPL